MDPSISGTPTDGTARELTVVTPPGGAVRASVDHWKRRLLDLSKRNRLLNFKPTRVSTVVISDEEPAEVFRRLWVKDGLMKFKAVLADKRRQVSADQVDELEAEPWANGDDVADVAPVDFKPYQTAALEDRHADDILQTASTPDELDRSLRRIDEQARLTVEEQGVNTLFLAIGMLAYRESSDSVETFRAPLVLLPVALTRRSARFGYVVTATDDDPVVNPALTEYLPHSFGLVLPDLPDADAMPDDYNLRDWFSDLAGKIDGQPGWSVQKNIYLGLFSFQKFVMYKDLEKNAPACEAHRLIRQIVLRSGGQVIGLPDDVRGVDLDREYPAEETFQVVDADSSQLRAMAAVARGHDLVLEGPPGTGKSQTITNLIAQALSDGKSVLFVAEKMAALEVVHGRLTEAGLGEFCLEVHSAKANKRAVIEQVRSALDASLQRPVPPDVPMSRVKELRTELTTYVRDVHRSHGALAISPYRALGELGAVNDAPKLKWSGDASKVTAEVLRQGERELQDVAAVATEIGDPRVHPWRDTTKTFYSEAELDELRDSLNQLAALLGDLIVHSTSIHVSFGLPSILTMKDVETANVTAQLLARSPGAPLEVLKSEEWNAPPRKALDLVSAGRALDELRRRVSERFIADVLLQEHAADISYVERKAEGVFGWFAFLDGRYRAIRRRWKSYRRPDYRATVLEQAAEMRVVDRYSAERRALAGQNEHSRKLFGGLWKGEQSDWELLGRYIEWVVEFRKACVVHCLEEQAIQRAATTGFDVTPVSRLVELSKQVERSLQGLRRDVGWPDGYLREASFDEMNKRVAALVESLQLAPRWAAFETARATCAAGIAGELLPLAMNAEVAFANLPRAFRRAFFQRWLTEVVQERPSLKGFQTISHERRVEEFRELDRAVLQANRATLVGQLRDKTQERLRAPEAMAAMPFLRGQMARQRNLAPLRKTMQASSAAIRAIKPCFLMSPLTVAQLLDGSAPTFDLVIFDEASQLPAEDAAGAIIRGKQLAVVGDPKQLPPTTFFAVMTGLVNAPVADDGTPLYEDTESILENAMAAGLPTSRLKWHYRSAHESLIAFSNISFYDADLYTFPSVDTHSDRYGLQFEFVEGVYEGKGLNVVEARRVADAVAHHAKVCPDMSLGVGTFNLRQQLAIQDELEVRRRQDPALEAFFTRTGEPFFVKNLENIQGDERDVIFVSVTYAKAVDGRLRYNFGPLNSQNGWRRLNVLITRARKRMRVFASMRGEDINPSATSSEGPRLLREFLIYAEHGRLESPLLGRRANTESPFEREVFSELSRRGLRLQPQVGVVGYRIDFGVLDDEVQGRFVCGIECDGVAYHNAGTVRDRDRLRQEALEARGWRIHRVWSTDWFKDRAGQLERLVRLIEESKRRAREEAQAEAEARARCEVEQPDEAEPEPLPGNATAPWPEGARPDYVRPEAEPYRLAAGAGRYQGRNLLEESASVVRQAVESVVAIEGPLHVDDLAARVAGMWGVRVGSRIADKIGKACREAERERTVFVRGQFMWPAAERPLKVRSRAETRIPAHRIPPEEYRETTLMVLRASGGLPKDQVVSEVRAVLGFGRTGKALEEAISSVIDELIAAGVAGEASTGLMLRGTTPGPNSAGPSLLAQPGVPGREE